MELLFLKRTTNIANPIAASAAATVNIKNTNTCPTSSPRYLENAIKLKLTASNMSSMHINNSIRFLRLMKIPAIAKVKRTAESEIMIETN